MKKTKIYKAIEVGNHTFRLTKKEWDLKQKIYALSQQVLDRLASQHQADQKPSTIANDQTRAQVS